MDSRYHIITFGCQMNEADSDVMASLLDQAGWTAASDASDADLVVLNTCSVREKPEHKADSLLGELREMKDERPGLSVIVTGCMAQREGEALAKRSRWVDAVLGTRCFHHIVDVAGRVRRGERPIVITDLEDDPAKVRCGPLAEVRQAPLKAFVPIILGCTNFCSYCIVPHVRGAEASRPAAEIIGEVRDLAARGTREVTLLGQNVLAWGRDLPTRPTFDSLLSLFDDRSAPGIDGLWRVRFLTCHPRDVNRELIGTVADIPAACEHIHLPIQAGTDKLLRDMNRGYTVDQYRAVVGRLRAGIPGISITTDMMVGFPGETEQDFERSLTVYEEIGFDAAFMFAYSPRPGTPAAERTDQVPKKVRVERLNRLIEMQNRITVERNRWEVGNIAEVLAEGPAHKGPGLLEGKTRTNKHVVFPGDRRLVGTLAKIRLTEATLWGFRGEVAT
jgi:tRNA-2-methylthio-N6-dimethylallyladenosine synthase